MRTFVFGLLAGVFFGVVLGWAGLTDPATIRQMLLLEDLYVFWLMGSAVATAAVGIRLLRRFGARTLTGEKVAFRPSRIERRHLVGSVLFGAGWAVSGACPAPVAAQLGMGEGSALYTAAGLIGGVLLVGAWRRRGAVTASGESIAAS